MLRLTIFLVIATIAIPTNGLNSRKLDETTPTTSDNNKCGSCPQVPPPPPPSPPSQPSPQSPPPPAPDSPSKYCPPPPSGSSKPHGPTPPSEYVYVTGPPGNLYPVDNYHSGATRGFTMALPLMIGCLYLAMKALW